MIVHEYDPTWPDAFEQLKGVYQKVLGELIIAIEHVGSTSIPGLKAKPTIDIDIVIKDYDIFPKVVEKLTATHLQDSERNVKWTRKSGYSTVQPRNSSRNLMTKDT